MIIIWSDVRKKIVDPVLRKLGYDHKSQVTTWAFNAEDLDKCGSRVQGLLIIPNVREAPQALCLIDFQGVVVNDALDKKKEDRPQETVYRDDRPDFEEDYDCS